jgi:hypothetical protein
LSTGDSTTRTLEITATGLQGSQLPPITSLGGSGGIKGLRFYPDKETIEQREISQGLEGYRLQSEALVSSEAGNWTLPERTIPWWNTKTDRLEFARLPKERISVASLVAATGTTSNDPSALVIPSGDQANNTRLWQVGAVAGWLVAMLLGGILFARRQNATPDPNNPQIAVQARKVQHLMSVRKACSTNDPYAARLAVLAWGRNQFDNLSPNTLNSIATKVGGDLEQELRAIDTLLFSTGDLETWHGAQLFKLLKAYDDGPDSGLQNELSLYPTR